MATTFLAGYLTSYTNSTWTDLITAPSGHTLVVRHYMFCNTAVAAINISMRIVNDADAEQAILVDDYELDIDKPLNCVQAFLMLPAGYSLQVQADAAGVHFSCWGGYE